jgi:hypothetical protein
VPFYIQIFLKSCKVLIFMNRPLIHVCLVTLRHGDRLSEGELFIRIVFMGWCGNDVEFSRICRISGFKNNLFGAMPI